MSERYPKTHASESQDTGQVETVTLAAIVNDLPTLLAARERLIDHLERDMPEDEVKRDRFLTFFCDINNMDGDDYYEAWDDFEDTLSSDPEKAALREKLAAINDPNEKKQFKRTLVWLDVLDRYRGPQTLINGAAEKDEDGGRRWAAND